MQVLPFSLIYNDITNLSKVQTAVLSEGYAC